MPLIASAQESPDAGAPDVIIEGVRPTEAGPMPGLLIRKDQIPGNIQSAGQKEIQESRALNVGDFMNTQMQGVSVNDYSGNPFQMDVNYRGFTASPQTGTPQGLSAFFDGIRVNEPFGDIVNWDLIPLNAVERFDVFPGSNPLFGLNTLGGALSLRTRSGFTSPGTEVSALAGSFGRTDAQAAIGGNNGSFGGFVAVHYFDEDGWRDNSPSRVRQLFARGDWRGTYGVLTASALLADNDLIGNGLIPVELYAQRPEAVFSSPDESNNTLAQFALSGAYDATDVLNFTAQVYHRKSDRDGLNGDIYEGFDDFTKDHDFIIDPARPFGDTIVARNGANQNNRVGGITNGTGVVAGTPIGLLTPTDLHQATSGGAVQSNWNLPTHKFMIGASFDRSQTQYFMSQRLALIDASHAVYLDSANIDPVYYAASHDIPGNDFHGTETTKSAYFNETWSIVPNFHLTLAGRYNKSDVDSDLLVRKSTEDLHELRSTRVDLQQLINEQTRTAEKFDYGSFNPQIGVNYLPIPTVNLYANVSRGARVPSVVELGCAFDSTPVDISVGSAVGQAPRSLLTAGCSLPTTLSGDPFLPQIRSKSGEAGARGNLGAKWNWDLSLFRTDLENDIYFVGVGDNKSYFDTVGKTRRQGLELGIDGSVGPLDIRLGYSYTEATFQSTFYTVSPHNSTADFDQNSQSQANLPELAGSQSLPTPNASANNGRGTYHMIRIDPGASLPGIPRYNYNAHFTLNATPRWKIGLGVVAHSSSFVRGNENNLHEPAGTDQETGLYYCTNGAGCGVEGLMQNFVRRGRPFTTGGELGGFVLFDLDTSVQITQSLTLFAQVRNLFDREYFSAGRLGVDPFSPSTAGVIGPSGWNYNSSEWQNTTFVGPGAPRGVWVGITYQSKRARR
ncbi:MAG: TonB-dependent receptor [Gammaproteobacteria bacterium]